MIVGEYVSNMELDDLNRTSGGPESLVERGLEKEPRTKASAGEAVLLGALAQGVNVRGFLPILYYALNVGWILYVIRRS